MSPSSGDALVCCVKKGRYQRLQGITLVPPNNYTTAWFYEVVGQALVFWLPSVRLQFTTTERALRNLAPIWPPVGLYWILPQPLARTTKLLCAFQPVLFPVVRRASTGSHLFFKPLRYRLGCACLFTTSGSVDPGYSPTTRIRLIWISPTH